MNWMLKAQAVAFLAFAVLIGGCQDEPKAQSPRAAAPVRATISPDRHDYLSTAFRARDSAQRQLGAVQHERQNQIELEKSFDRPTQGKGSP